MPMHDDTSDLPPLGLGLEIPEPLPSPSKFLESSQDIDTMESFILVGGKNLVFECGQESSFSQVEDLVSANRYLEAIRSVIQICGQVVADKDQEYAAEAIESGREEEIKDELHAKATHSVKETAKILNEHVWPSNAVEAQIISEVMDINEWNQAIVPTALSFWIAYENGTRRDELQLSNVYRGLLRAQGDSETIQKFMKNYPWGESLCLEPNVSSLIKRIENKLAYASNMASKKGNAEDAKWISSHYGRLVKVTMPTFEYYKEMNWWVGLLAVEAQIDAHISYWENITASAWPTEDEAKFMLSAYRNHTRTLWTERFLQPYISYFENPSTRPPFDWHTDREFGAVAFMGKMAIRWPYADLQCSA